MTPTALGLLISSAVFMGLVNKTEIMIRGSDPIGLIAAVLVIANFLLSIVALIQCAIASAFAGMTYSTCGEDPGPPPETDSWLFGTDFRLRMDFRQCVSYRSEIRTSAVFMVLFGIGLAVMCITSIVVFVMYRTSFGVISLQQMLQEIEFDVGAIQQIFNLQSQYPDRNPCGIEELQQLQQYISEIQTKLREAAFIPHRRNFGAPLTLMNLQPQVTALQQTINTHIQETSQPQHFQPQPMNQGYPTGYPMGHIPYPQGQGQPVPYQQGQGQPVPYPQGHAMYYDPGVQATAPLMNIPQEGQQGHQPGSELPPSYDTVMSKGQDGEKNWV